MPFSKHDQETFQHFNMKALLADHPLDRPERACANCGKRFQPTIKRRLLCNGCWKGGDDYGDYLLGGE